MVLFEQGIHASKGTKKKRKKTNTKIKFRQRKDHKIERNNKLYYRIDVWKSLQNKNNFVFLFFFSFVGITASNKIADLTFSTRLAIRFVHREKMKVNNRFIFIARKVPKIRKHKLISLRKKYAWAWLIGTFDCRWWLRSTLSVSPYLIVRKKEIEFIYYYLFHFYRVNSYTNFIDRQTNREHFRTRKATEKK